MRHRWLAAAALTLLSPAAVSAQAGGTDAVERLAWLGGHWGLEEGELWTEEHWTAPRGGVMLGTNLSGRQTRATGFEYLRIEVEPDGSVVYRASPNGRPPVAFRLVVASGEEAVFENPEHDFPTRIVYRRQGDALTATISGPNRDGEMSWTFRRR